MIFNLQFDSDHTFATTYRNVGLSDILGFPVVPYQPSKTLDACCARIDWIGDNRGVFPFDIDGAVIKINDLSQRRYLGNTAKFPRWAVAYKYPPEKKESCVHDIVVQVGRTGVLTPKAVIDPVRLAGTTVTNATLHNQDFIDNLDLRIGDTVLVQKAEIILRSSPSCVTSGRRARCRFICRIPARSAARRCARPGRGRPALHGRGVPGAAAAQHCALCLARGDGY